MRRFGWQQALSLPCFASAASRFCRCLIFSSWHCCITIKPIYGAVVTWMCCSEEILPRWWHNIRRCELLKAPESEELFLMVSLGSGQPQCVYGTLKRSCGRAG